MAKIQLENVTFKGDMNDREAVAEFALSDTGVTGTLRLTIAQTVHIVTYVVESVQTVDDVDVVRRARKELHDFATRLAEETKGWASE